MSQKYKFLSDGKKESFNTRLTDFDIIKLITHLVSREGLNL
jgi:hypothetical protein